MSAKKLSFLVKVVSLYFPSEFDFEMHIKFVLLNSILKFRYNIKSIVEKMSNLITYYI